MAQRRHSARSLEIATLLARSLGGTLLCLGLIVCAMLFADLDRLGPTIVSVNVAAVAIFMIVPGVLYFVFATPMGRERRWALVTIMVFAAIHIAGFALFPLLVIARGGGVGPVPLFFMGAVLLLASFLIVYGVRAIPATRAPSEHLARRGFEPLPVAGSSAPAPSFPVPPSSLKKRSPPPSDAT